MQCVNYIPGHRGKCSNQPIPHLLYHQVVLLTVVGYRRPRPRRCPRPPRLHRPRPLRPPLLQISAISPVFSTLLKPSSPGDLLVLIPLSSL